MASRSVDHKPDAFEPRADKDKEKAGLLAKWIYKRAQPSGGGRRHKGRGEEVEGNLFKQINDVRKPDLSDIDKRGQKIEAQNPYSDNIFGRIAQNKTFEIITLTLISLNAVAIGYDADYAARNERDDNLLKGPVQFIIIENFFCTYFFVEVAIRFLGYRRKVDAVKDASYVFDFLLVAFMVVETWILPFLDAGGPLAQFSILRLLRLLKITRMARLMRAVPEIMVIVKGIAAATRTVMCTGALLTCILYTFAIFFTNEYHEGEEGKPGFLEGPEQEFFGTMGKSMFTLFILGTILDDITQATNAIQLHETAPWFRLLAFLMFVLLASMMLLNMLIGVLVEVVSATSEAEREKAIETNVREAIAEIFEHMDKDDNNRISKAEFLLMKNDKKVMDALEELDIHPSHFEIYSELFFRPEVEGGPLPCLTYDHLMNMILRLRPGSYVSALDFAAFSKHIFISQENIKHRVRHIEKMCSTLALRICGDLSDETQAKIQVPLLDSRGTFFTGKSSDGAPSQNPGYSEQPASYLSRLERTASADLIEELQRRLGMADLGQTGVPLSMMDEELQTRVREAIPHASAQAFMTLGVPQDEAQR